VGFRRTKVVNPVVTVSRTVEVVVSKTVEAAEDAQASLTGGLRRYPLLQGRAAEMGESSEAVAQIRGAVEVSHPGGADEVD
jgi:hypothetical protein